LGFGGFALTRFVFRIYGRAWLVGAILASMGNFVTGLFYVNYYSVVTKLSTENIVTLHEPEDLFAAPKTSFFKLENYVNKTDLAEGHYVKSEGLKLHCVVYPIVGKNWQKEDSVRVWGAFITRSAFFEKNSPELQDRTNTANRLLWIYDDTAQFAAFRTAIDYSAKKQGLKAADKIIIAEWADIEDEKASLARKYWLALLLLNITWGVAVFVREMKPTEEKV
jgi:hypothetical protein